MTKSMYGAVILSLLMASGCEGGVGPQGFEGAQGPTAEQGPAGEQGARGDIGPTGDVGARGASGFGQFCGASSDASGNLGGWIGAKALCAATCSDTEAYMCTSGEMIIAAQRAMLPSSTGYWFGNAAGARDCQGFTSNAAGDLALVWFDGSTGGLPLDDVCSASHPIACCSQSGN